MHFESLTGLLQQCRMTTTGVNRRIDVHVTPFFIRKSTTTIGLADRKIGEDDLTDSSETSLKPPLHLKPLC